MFHFFFLILHFKFYSITSQEIMNQNNSQLGDNISRTTAPIRQLVEHFDHATENNSSGEVKDMGSFFCFFL